MLQHQKPSFPAACHFGEQDAFVSPIRLAEETAAQNISADIRLRAAATATLVHPSHEDLGHIVCVGVGDVCGACNAENTNTTLPNQMQASLLTAVGEKLCEIQAAFASISHDLCDIFFFLANFQ